MRRAPVARAGSNEEALADLVQRSRDGDAEAWAALWLALTPFVESIARRGWVPGRLAQCPDALGDIVTRVMEELREDGFARLGELGERLARRDGSFRPWLWRNARNAAVAYVRAYPEYMGQGEGGARRWASHVPVPEALEEEGAPVSRQVEVRLMLARSRDLLDEGQLDGLSRWLLGDDFDEIAAGLGLGGGAGAAERLVRSAVARLRARFGPPRRDRGLRGVPPTPDQGGGRVRRRGPVRRAVRRAGSA